MRFVPRLLLYMTAWVVTSVAISEITISFRGAWQPFSTPTAKVVEGPAGFAVNLIAAEGFFGLFNGAFHLLLLSALVPRLPPGRSILVPSMLTGLVLGLIFMGAWNGFLYAIGGHSSHPSIGQKLAVGILPYLAGGAVAGCLRFRHSAVMGQGGL